MENVLLRNHGADTEVRRLVQLSVILGRLHALPQWQRPSPADLTSLQEVASSGTASARQACHTLRHYVPACPCRLLEDAEPIGGKVLATKSATVNGTSSATALGTPHPNPAGSEFWIAYDLPATHSATIELRDELGRLVYQQVLQAGSGEARLPVVSLPERLDICTLIANGHIVAARPVAVQH